MPGRSQTLGEGMGASEGSIDRDLQKFDSRRILSDNIEKRKEVKQKLIQARGPTKQLLLEYSEKHKDVKKCARSDKGRRMDELVSKP